MYVNEELQELQVFCDHHAADHVSLTEKEKMFLNVLVSLTSKIAQLEQELDQRVHRLEQRVEEVEDHRALGI